jgi:hypothetical protein
MSEIPVRNRKWLWSQKSDYARLRREVKSFEIELSFLIATTEEAGKDWAEAARNEVGNVQYYLREKENIEGGWLSLHAARRYTVYALSRDKLPMLASVLRAEATKIMYWRGEEMKDLLDVKDEALTHDHITKAMALRDEYFSNQYHKIWLVGRQLEILLYSCGLGFLLMIPLLVFSSRHPGAALVSWGYQMVAAVLFFGLLGAAYSAAVSLMGADATARIPERVANQFVTTARALFGSGVGLAGYAFYQSKILDIHFGGDCGPGSAFTIAFLFGFAGERLIAQVLGTLGSRQSVSQK